MDYPVMAVVVTYNPEIPLLGRDLDALVGQVPHVSVYDNGSANTADIRALVEGYPKVSLVENHENLGLPVSYNRAMAEAVDRGYEWLLTMDQDSVLPEGYIEAASAYFDQSDIAVICPRYWDKNVLTLEQFRERTPDEPVSYVDKCISSGSLCRAEAHERIGGFDERMFIDYVDFDYCRTALERGYRILQLNRCVMAHSVGESNVVHVLGKTKVVFNHSPMRKYYYFRNKMYFARKHHYLIREHRYFYKLFLVSLLLVLNEKENVPKKFFMSVKGLISGLTMKIDR